MVERIIIVILWLAGIICIFKGDYTIAVFFWAYPVAIKAGDTIADLLKGRY